MDSLPENSAGASSGEYRTVAPDQSLPKTFRDAYWARVKQVLRDVFSGDDQDADAARKRLEDFEDEKGQPQTIFYHADPFEVAADLAGRRGQEITPHEKARYLDVLGQAERPPASHVNAMYPEDA